MVLESNILPFNLAASADHCPIQLKLDITLAVKDYTQPPAPPKIKTFNIPESIFDETWVSYVKTLDTHLSTGYWTKVAAKALEGGEALEAYSKLTTTIDLVASDTLGVRDRAIGIKGNFEDTGDYQHLHKVRTILLNCVLATPNTVFPHIPKAS